MHVNFCFAFASADEDCARSILTEPSCAWCCFDTVFPALAAAAPSNKPFPSRRMPGMLSIREHVAANRLKVADSDLVVALLTAFILPRASFMLGCSPHPLHDSLCVCVCARACSAALLASGIRNSLAIICMLCSKIRVAPEGIALQWVADRTVYQPHRACGDVRRINLQSSCMRLAFMTCCKGFLREMALHS